MKTIAENLQILKDSSDAIKQAIIDNGGTVTGGLSSYADAINNLFLITFNILEQEYKAKKDMTWEQWVNSEYNTINFSVYGDYIIDSTGMTIAEYYNNTPLNKSDKIISEAQYTLLP